MSSTPQLFLVQEDDEKDEIRFNTNNSLLIDESSQIVSEDEDEDEINNIVSEKKQDVVCFSTAAAAVFEDLPSVCSSTKSPNRLPLPSLGQFDHHHDEEEEEDDGFATPISTNYKIPVTAECPPAPKKIRTPNSSSSTGKRKSPSPTTTTRARRPLHLELSREIDDMFPPTVRYDLDRKIKRACTRTEFLL